MEPQATDEGTPVYVVQHAEIDLPAPPDEVWPHLLDYTSWQNFSSVEHISGPAGEAGELVKLQKVEPGAGKSSYLARTIILEPGRRALWKIYREVLVEGDATFGIVDFSLAPTAEGSTFSADVFYEFATSHAVGGEWTSLGAKYNSNVQTLMRTVLPKLQKVVAGGEAA